MRLAYFHHLIQQAGELTRGHGFEDLVELVELILRCHVGEMSAVTAVVVKVWQLVEDSAPCEIFNGFTYHCVRRMCFIEVLWIWEKVEFHEFLEKRRSLRDIYAGKYGFVVGFTQSRLHSPMPR